MASITGHRDIGARQACLDELNYGFCFQNTLPLSLKTAGII
jgi:hypothetical protein